MFLHKKHYMKIKKLNTIPLKLGIGIANFNIF